MSVSVIIPVYNGEKYLKEAVVSALNQKGGCLREVIVVDDGSTDKTAEICKELGSDISYLSQVNQGVGAARNNGAKQAKGRFLAFLDADDLWREDKLERQLKVLNETGADMVYSWIKHFKCPKATGTYAQSLKPMPGLFATTLVIKKDSLVKSGGFSEIYQVGEFLDWYSRAQSNGLTAEVVEEVLAFRRIHDTNMTTQLSASTSGYADVLKAHLDRKRKR